MEPLSSGIPHATATSVRSTWSPAPFHWTLPNATYQSIVQTARMPLVPWPSRTMNWSRPLMHLRPTMSHSEVQSVYGKDIINYFRFLNIIIPSSNDSGWQTIKKSHLPPPRGMQDWPNHAVATVARHTAGSRQYVPFHGEWCWDLPGWLRCTF